VLCANHANSLVDSVVIGISPPLAVQVSMDVCSRQEDKRMAIYEFTVVTERDEDGRYLAVCPALQGCYTEGDTEEEARLQIPDAIRLHLEDRLRRGEPVYEEVGATTVRVAV